VNEIFCHSIRHDMLGISLDTVLKIALAFVKGVGR